MTHMHVREVTTPRALLEVGSPGMVHVSSDIFLVYVQFGDDETIGVGI